VKVELLAVPFDQLQNKFQTEASAGGGPDILIGPADWIGPFQKAQLIADVGKAAYLDRFIAPASNALKVSGKQYAIPESVEAVALYYNKDKVKTPPAKVEDLLKEAEANGAAWHNGFYQNVGYLYAHGGKLFNDNFKVVFDDANGAQWLTFMSNLCKTKNVTCDGDDAKLDALFKQGQVAFRNNGPWALGDYKKALGDKLGVVPLPAAASPASPFLGTKNFMVNANSKNQDLALAFLDYMTSNGVQTVFMNKAGHLPANKNVDVSKSPDAAGFVKQATTAVPQPTVPEMGKVWEPAGNAIQEVLQGKKQPQAALTDAAKLINAANNKQ
jgi:arabinogalactan oligomer / maltooligosaccharide transport system substrate-binding protein